MTTPNEPATRQELIRSYNLLVGGIEDEAIDDEERAYGGVIRAAKGKLVESMAPHIVRLAWADCGGQPDRLSFGDAKTYRVPVAPDYVDRLPDEIRDYISARLDQHFYRAQVDQHIFVDGAFAIGVECKSYTENAMLKRILVDFRLLKSLHPDLVCCLLQLESQLGGGYSDPLAEPQTGSPSSHTLMSYFPEVELHIITLLEGERKIDRPIHRAQHFKELSPEVLEHAIKRFSALLEPFI